MSKYISDFTAKVSLKGVASLYCYENGAVRDCILNEENYIPTRYGNLIPRYGPEEIRRKYKPSISFYRSGAVKSLSLEQQADIMTTLGAFPAELLTFYESGSLKRLFPLNGKISGYWTEADEEKLCRKFRFSLSFGSFKAKIISLCFYESGNLKALTLWPGETVILKKQTELFPVRTGFSLYEDGSLKSIEPAYELSVPTPIGWITAFDENALGISGENNSLCFKKDGSLHSLITSSSKIAVINKDGVIHVIGPIVKPDPVEEGKSVLIPLKISFEGNCVRFEEETIRVFDMLTSEFTVLNISSETRAGLFCGDCSNCSRCKL